MDHRHHAGQPLDRETFIAHVEKLSPHTVFAPLGIRIERADPDAFAVALDVDERHFQHLGIVHGGVNVLLAESAASMAAAMSVDVTRNAIFGVDINATHLKAKRSGTLIATARPIHRGRTIHVYAIEVLDEDGDLVCVSRCTIAVRPRKPADPTA